MISKRHMKGFSFTDFLIFVGIAVTVLYIFVSKPHRLPLPERDKSKGSVEQLTINLAVEKIVLDGNLISDSARHINQEELTRAVNLKLKNQRQMPEKPLPANVQ